MKAVRDFIDVEAVEATLARATAPDRGQLEEILSRARALEGLQAEDVAALALVTDPECLAEIFAAARFVKQQIYGNRLVLFAPLYVSNLCSNECLYCAFRRSNTAVRRRALTLEEIRRETLALVEQGHKRILLVAGEAYPAGGFSYVLDAIRTIYSTKSGNGEIRRVNVNVAPLAVEQFRELKAAGIGTYQLFQETYDPRVYARVHVAGPKADYSWRLTAMDRAMEAGIDDVGIGVLFGLADWRFELLAMLQHIRHLEEMFGVGPHTISVPRMEPAVGSEMSRHPPAPVADDDFKKIVAILRLAVPYTGIIMSTRESPEMRRETFGLGVSQISAGSRTNPGGYTEKSQDEEAAQFALGDHRPLDAVVRDLVALGYIPSFCTSCYRLGRTGEKFMALAKPGDIKERCAPNALATFLEYLLDYAAPETRAAGEALIPRLVAELPEEPRRIAERLLSLVRAGKRDVFC